MADVKLEWDPPSGGGRASFGDQLKALLIRNLTLKKRHKRNTMKELFVPIYFVLILVLINFLVKLEPSPENKHFTDYSLSDFPFSRSKRLLVVPNTTQIASLMEEVVSKLPYSDGDFDLYNTMAEAEAVYKKNESLYLAGLEFADGNLQTLDYTIRMDHQKVPSTQPSDFKASAGECRHGSGLDMIGCTVNQYLYSGFATLQNAVDTALMKVVFNSSMAPVQILEVQMMPQYVFNPEISFMQILAGLYFVMAYSPFINFLTVSLVTEKERKIKESMRMMGLRDSVFWLSWSLIYLVAIVLVSAVITLLSWGAGLFKHSNMFFFFLLLVLYGMTVINLGFLFSTFFSKAETAGAFASLITMMFTLLYLAVSLTRTGTGPDGPISSVPTWGQWLMSLLSPIALALSLDMSVYLDLNGVGVQVSTLTQGQFPIAASITMLLIDMVLYGLLAFYFDNVLPNEFGLRRPAWFCLLPSYWWPRKPMSDRALGLSGSDNEAINLNESTEGPATIEGISPVMRDKNVIRIFNIMKEYESKDKKVKAVDGLSLDIYEGQITAILGHNGAGKTTLISLLTGLSHPTSGSASIYGLNVTDSAAMTEIRSMTGVCPQENVLFDVLTCREHLRFYGIIKGVREQEIEAAISQTMADVSLSEQIDVLASKLSGGQKRKLSVAVAIIGDPKIIFLDEPTAGMDPASRRHLWSLLKKRKQGRVILLTTHFMDEADILADRKAIVSKGRLKCCGSSLFLKNKFGIGYHLSMVVDAAVSINDITSIIEGHIPDASLQRKHGKEVSYTLPHSSSQSFAGLFEELESRDGSETQAERLGIDSYGVSMTTLEEVFLELGAEEEADDEGVCSDELQPLGETTVTPHTQEELESFKPTADSQLINKQRFFMLFCIRVKVFFRLKLRVFFTVFFPLIFIIAGSVLYKTGMHASPPPITSLPLTADLYVESNMTLAEDVAPVAYNISGGSLSPDFIQTLESAGWETNNTPGIDGLYDNPGHYIGLHLKSLQNFAQGSIYSRVTIQYNHTAAHSIPAAMNLVTNTLLQMAAPAANLSIKTSSFPWGSALAPNAGWSGTLFGATIMLGMALAITPSSMAVQVVREREIKVRSQLRVAGISLNLYWASTFLFDFLVYFFVAALGFIIMEAFQIPALTQTGAILSIILLFISYLPVNILFVYILSFAFDKRETVQRTLPTFLTWASFLPYVIVMSLDMTGNGNVATALHYVFCIVDPGYTVFGGLYYIDRIHLHNVLIQGQETDIPISWYFKWSSLIPVTYVVPLLHVPWMYFALKYLEVKKTGGDPSDVCCGQGKYKEQVPDNNDDIPVDEDPDVAAERERVAHWQPGSMPAEPVVVVRNLRKEFNFSKKICKEPVSCGICKQTTESEKKRVAVRNQSFLVEAGEVFGLLGPNGAGKTTTLNVIIAEQGPTAGKVYVSGVDVRSSLSEAFSEMGYCPQHDPLWDYITVREHIELYAAARGILQEHVPDLATYFLESLRIKEHADKLSRQCSGGTKRKLAYALGMLGLPRVVLLDEPSTGMDPRSKRFLWDTISASFASADRGAILTTHYMEEADALCNRVGIMTNGQLQCLGSTQHLKSRYGSGYSLEVKVGSDITSSTGINEDMEKLNEFILKIFPDAVQTECVAERAIYKIPQKNVTSLGFTFRAFENGRAEYNIEEYSFSQSTLEQVFLEFAKHQVEEENGDAQAMEEFAKKARTVMRTISEDCQNLGTTTSSTPAVISDSSHQSQTVV